MEEAIIQVRSRKDQRILDVDYAVDQPTWDTLASDYQVGDRVILTLDADEETGEQLERNYPDGMIVQRRLVKAYPGELPYHLSLPFRVVEREHAFSNTQEVGQDLVEVLVTLYVEAETDFIEDTLLRVAPRMLDPYYI